MAFKELELKIQSPKGTDSTAYLENAYQTYIQASENRDNIIQTYIASYFEAMSHENTIDPNKILPVIKDRRWLEEIPRVVAESGMKQEVEQVFEDFNSELIILYGQYFSSGIAYLVPTDLDDAKIERKNLRNLACENLKRLFPKIQCHVYEHVRIITAECKYDASLLLIDFIWDKQKLKVEGDIVVAVPSGDFLLVTGSNDREGIDKIKEIALQAYNADPYRISANLYIYRNGVFENFESR